MWAELLLGLLWKDGLLCYVCMQYYLQSGMDTMIVNTTIYIPESVAFGIEVDVISASTVAWWHITMSSR